MNPVASIIIITRNRAEHLRETLESLRSMVIPADLPTELLVVDNGSTDTTAQVVENVRHSSPFSVQYHHEPRPGKSNACNIAIAKAEGSVLLWTDDDVRVPMDWVARLTAPILSGNADGVGAPVRLAKHLERSWMTRTHYDRLADDRFAAEPAMIGANKAYHRRILDRIDGYDPEIGPGALGTWDDGLFFYKFKIGGYTVGHVPEAGIEHHFEPSRLLRKAWLRSGVIGGESLAYIDYHWAHEPFARARFEWARWKAMLRLFRMVKPPPRDENTEGCHRVEIRMVDKIAYYGYAVEHCFGKPRNYEKNGLVKQVNPFRAL